MRPDLVVRLSLALTISAAGCASSTLPDPNDLGAGPTMSLATIQGNLGATSDMLNERQSKGEINGYRYQELIARRANELLKAADMSQVTEANAWAYAEVCITARDWVGAEMLLKIALRRPPTTDRRVNDTLRLARVECELGRVPEGVKLAYSVFDVPPVEKAPILPAVLLEIVPAGMGKADEAALADLLLGAVRQNEQTVVDPTTIAGKEFLMARRKHIEAACQTAAMLFESSHMSSGEARAKNTWSAYVRSEPFSRFDP